MGDEFDDYYNNLQDESNSDVQFGLIPLLHSYSARLIQKFQAPICMRCQNFSWITTPIVFFT